MEERKGELERGAREERREEVEVGRREEERKGEGERREEEEINREERREEKEAQQFLPAVGEIMMVLCCVVLCFPRIFSLLPNTHNQIRKQGKLNTTTNSIN